jgi:hypothetical protein
MHAGQVISLQIVVDASFPVALHVVGSALEQLHPGKRKLFYRPRPLAQALPQRPRVQIDIHENQIEPLFRRLLGFSAIPSGENPWTPSISVALISAPSGS